MTSNQHINEFRELKPCKGALALNENGILGLILCDQGDRFDVVDDKRVVGWDGICLESEALGDRWFSANPVIVGFSQDILSVLSRYVHGASVMSDALDQVWKAMYPGSEWEYPGQVAAHAKAILEELHYDPKTRKQVEASPDSKGDSSVEGGASTTPA